MAQLGHSDPCSSNPERALGRPGIAQLPALSIATQRLESASWASPDGSLPTACSQNSAALEAAWLRSSPASLRSDLKLLPATLQALSIALPTEPPMFWAASVQESTAESTLASALWSAEVDVESSSPQPAAIRPTARRRRLPGV